VDGTRKVVILLLLAAAVPAAAGTFGLSAGSSTDGVCLSIGAATYRVSSGTARADYTVRIDPAAPSPDIRIHLAATPDEADFVFVDDGDARPNCHADRGSPLKTVKISTAATRPDLVVGLAPASAADYRIYVRSERLSPEAAASLYAIARMPTRPALAGR